MFEAQCKSLNKTNGTPKGKRSYTIKEVSTILNICRESASALIKRENLSYIRIGREVRIPKAEFDSWLTTKFIGKE